MVTQAVNHFEACERLARLVGMCVVVVAFLEFFNMEDSTHKPIRKVPVMQDDATDNGKKEEILKVLEKFLDKYIF